MSLMNLSPEGYWSLSSKSDPRWNCGGYGYVGGLIIPQDCQKRIEELKKILGEPPKDLEWSYDKY